MRVAMVGWELAPLFVGGMGVYCQALVRELSNLNVETQFYLPVLKRALRKAKRLPHAIPVPVGQSPSGYSPLNNISWEGVHDFSQRLEEQFDPTGVDLVHAHDWMSAVAGLAISQRYNLPLVLTVHSTEYDRAGGGRPHPAIMHLEQVAVERAQRTIAVSNHTKKILISKVGAPGDRIQVIHNGIDTARFQRLRRERTYDERKKNVLFLGRVTGQKGPGDFLTAAKLLLEQGRRDVSFTIAGDGDLLPDLKRDAALWGIERHVRFLGRVVDKDQLACYRKATLFALPSLSEPFGLTVLEAMASGLPVIITHTTGAGEVVENVVRVHPNDPHELAQAIATLLDSPDVRQILGESGAMEAEEFHWARVASQTSDVYASVLSEWGGASK